MLSERSYENIALERLKTPSDIFLALGTFHERSMRTFMGRSGKVVCYGAGIYIIRTRIK